MRDYPEQTLIPKESVQIGDCEGSGCEIYANDTYFCGEEGLICDREDCAWNFLESMYKSGRLSSVYILEMLGYERVTPDV